MKKILVPIDFSSNAKKALEYAMLLAKRSKAEIILCHAYNIVYVSPDVPIQFYAEELDRAESSSFRRIRKLCQQVKLAKIPCTAVCEAGIASDIIFSAIRKKRADLVIMGSTGSGKVRKMLLGSNTIKVISKASCPVIAVPLRTSYPPIKKIVYATDYKAGDIAALKGLVNIARLYNSAVSIVHVADGTYVSSYEQECMKRLSLKVREKIPYKRITFDLLENEEVEKELQRYIKYRSADLLVFCTKHKGLLERLFTRSIVKKLVFHTRIPLMAYHPR